MQDRAGIVIPPEEGALAEALGRFFTDQALYLKCRAGCREVVAELGWDRLSEQMEAGTLGINDGSPSTSQSPFGGVKQSGWGRELGVEGLEAFLETKHVSIGGG